MNYTLFSQILALLPREIIQAIVDKHSSDKHSKGISTHHHLVSMLFCQFSGAQSLREISNGLRSATGNLNHMGLSFAPSKSSLSYLNKHRSWEVFRDIYFALQNHFSAYLQRNKATSKLRIKGKIFALDATTVSLCLEAFDWAHYRTSKGGIKLHTLLDFDGCMPAYLHLTPAREHEAKIAKQISIPQGSVVVADRGFLDFALMSKWEKEKVRFVVRSKDNVKYEVLEQLPRRADRPHILADEKVAVSGYEKPLRLVLVQVEDDKGQPEQMELLSNNFSWTADTIRELYKQRWLVEIFFRDIKQHLKIKSFIGCSENAVLTQIWTALITMLLLKVLKKKAEYEWCLSNLVAFLRLNLFVKIDLTHWLNKPFTTPIKAPPNQTSLFEVNGF